MANIDDIVCTECGAKEGYEELDGFYYCRVCSKQAEGIMDTDFQIDDVMEKGNPKFHHSVHRLRNPPKNETVNLLSQSETQDFGGWSGEEEKVPKEEGDVEEGCMLNDFGASVDVSQLSVEDLSSEIRMRYVMGIQLMIEFQCEVLVEKFGVSPLICGIAGVIWMRFVVASRVFDEQWADQTFEESEIQYQGDAEERTIQSQHSKGTVNMYGQSGVIIWFRSLRKRIPLSSSLAVSFLACHIAREPILPADMHMWALEGKLPYLTAFIDIEKRFGRPSSACPLSSSIMFRPFKVVGSRELESQSGFVAQSIGLQLPPVNFFAIARRYLKQLSLPQEKILPHAARIYEWSMPPDLWLSANPKRLPARVCVMSIIMLTVRLLYNINGFGKWEASLPSTPVKKKIATSKSKKRKNVSKGPGKKKNNSNCSGSRSKKRKSVSKEPEKTKNNSNCSGSKSKKRKSVSKEPEKTKNNSNCSGSKPKKRKSVSKEPEKTKNNSSCSGSKSKKRKSVSKEPEKTKNNSNCSGSSSIHGINSTKLGGTFPTQSSDSDTTELLCNLEAGYEKTHDARDYSKDLPTYLKYCKDVVFAGLKPLLEDIDEETIIEKLWNFYNLQEDTEEVIDCKSTPREKRSTNNECIGGVSKSDESLSKSIYCSQDKESNTPREQEDLTPKVTAIKRMKLNMEENGFCYIPPRVRMRRLDHLHYIRKNDGGSRSYVAHADYYILLRACAQVAQVSVRYMHEGALKLEKRLSWIENRIDQSLHFRSQNPSPESNINVDQSEDMPVSPEF